jgi:hypothetical protein
MSRIAELEQEILLLDRKLKADPDEKTQAEKTAALKQLALASWPARVGRV